MNTLTLIIATAVPTLFLLSMIVYLTVNAYKVIVNHEREEFDWNDSKVSLFDTRFNDHFDHA